MNMTLNLEIKIPPKRKYSLSTVRHVTGIRHFRILCKYRYAINNINMISIEGCCSVLSTNTIFAVSSRIVEQNGLAKSDVLLYHHDGPILT